MHGFGESYKRTFLSRARSCGNLVMLFVFMLNASKLSSRPMALGTSFNRLLSRVNCFAPAAPAFKITASMLTGVT